MRLPSAGREYATWTVTSSEEGIALEATFDDGTTWHPLETIDATTFRALIAGPDATTNPPGTIVLTLGRHFGQIRATDTPEIIIRDAGTIDVT
jgi:hypothetical protein